MVCCLQSYTTGVQRCRNAHKIMFTTHLDHGAGYNHSEPKYLLHLLASGKKMKYNWLLLINDLSYTVSDCILQNYENISILVSARDITFCYHSQIETMFLHCPDVVFVATASGRSCQGHTDHRTQCSSWTGTLAGNVQRHMGQTWAAGTSVNGAAWSAWTN